MIGRPLGCALVGAAVLLAGCAGADPATQPSDTSSAGVPADEGLRPVRLTHADAIGYLLPETAAQVLCQALSPEEWRAAVGGAVGRAVHTTTEGAECVVAGDGVRFALSTTAVEVAGVTGAQEEVAGHPVRVGDLVAVAALLPIGERDLDTQEAAHATPVLTVGGATPDLARDVLEALLPRLVLDGVPTPVADASGTVPFTPTAPVADVALYDLPRPVQGLVLCTTLGGADVRVDAAGECRTGARSAAVRLIDEPVAEGATVAGRPAVVADGVARVELRRLPAEATPDTAYVVLELRDPAATATQLTAMAEAVASAVL